MQSWLELPALYGAQLFYRLEKAGRHKYIKRVPTGNPRRPYRYYYNVAHGLGVASHEHMVEGASFKHGGGHWHIKHVDGDKLHIEHDESKEAKSISKSDLADMLRSEHGAALKEHEAKKAAELEDTKQHGSDKQRVRVGLKTKAEEAEARQKQSEPSGAGKSLLTDKNHQNTKDTTPRHIWMDSVLTAANASHDQALPYKERMNAAYNAGETVGMVASEIRLRLHEAEKARRADSDMRALREAYKRSTSDTRDEAEAQKPQESGPDDSGHTVPFSSVHHEHKPRFDRYSSPQYPRLSKDKAGSVFLFHGDPQQAAFYANSRHASEGQSYNAERIAKYKAAVASGYAPKRVQVGGNTALVFEKDGNVLTPDGATKLVSQTGIGTSKKPAAVQPAAASEPAITKETSAIEPPKREPRTTAFDESEAAVPAFKPPESVPDLSAKASDLSYETAKNAHAGSSFVPERRARQEQAGYVEAMQTIADKLGKFATPENTAQIKAAFDEYKRDYLKHMHAKLAADSRTMSSMITGPSNFPKRSNEKKLGTAHKRLEEFLDWHTKANKRINEQFNPAVAERRPISSDDSDAAGKIDKKLETMKAAHERMKQANAIVRGKGTNEEKVAKMVAVGFRESMAKELLVPDFMGRVGFADYQMKNSLAEIKRLGERSKSVASESAKPTKEHVFEGGRIVDDADENRVQIFYDSKPDAETIAKLKSRGFKWAPSHGAWQRLRNNAARYAAGVVTGAKMGDEADISKALSAAMAGWSPMAKAVAKPPAGFVPIPNSKHGGYHKRIGNTYETWYPSYGSQRWAVSGDKYNPDRAVRPGGHSHNDVPMHAIVSGEGHASVIHDKEKAGDAKGDTEHHVSHGAAMDSWHEHNLVRRYNLSHADPLDGYHPQRDNLHAFYKRHPDYSRAMKSASGATDDDMFRHFVSRKENEKLGGLRFKYKDGYVTYSHGEPKHWSHERTVAVGSPEHKAIQRQADIEDYFRQKRKRIKAES